MSEEKKITRNQFSRMSDEELCKESFCREKKPCEWRELHKELKKRGHYGISIVKRHPFLSCAVLQCAGAVIGSMIIIILFKWIWR